MPPGADQLQLVIEEGNPPLMVFTGALELHLSSTIRSVLDDALATGADDVYLDLGGVDRIDSHVVGLFTATVKRLRDRGGRMRVLRISSPARRVFELTGLSRILVMPADESPTH
jgi:anti-anti-sigma factor